MTELAIPDERGDVVPMTEPMTGLVKWAMDARHAHQIAVSLSKTSFVPATMRGKADDITAAILAGDELGLKPMASLRSMDIIQGTPALRAHAMRGLLQSHGHEVELVSSTVERCEMRGRRKGSEAWQSVTWTIDRAAALGLTTKPEWKKQPQTMLVARATGEICRLIASDVLHAMPYAAEELDGGMHEASRGVVRTEVPTAAEILGAPVPADGIGAPVAADTQDDVPADDAPPLATKAQLTKLHTVLGACGVADRTEGLTTLGMLVSRSLESSKELTKAEALYVIDTLDRCAAADDPAVALGEHLADLDRAAGES